MNAHIKYVCKLVPFCFSSIGMRLGSILMLYSGTQICQLQLWRLSSFVTDRASGCFIYLLWYSSPFSALHRELKHQIPHRLRVLFIPLLRLYILQFSCQSHRQLCFSDRYLMVFCSNLRIPTGFLVQLVKLILDLIDNKFITFHLTF
jgi:hypothetical protein